MNIAESQCIFHSYTNLSVSKSLSSQHSLNVNSVIENIGYVSILLASLGILWEQSHRRVEINYFLLPKFFEILWNFLERRKFVKSFPGQEVTLFLTTHT